MPVKGRFCPGWGHSSLYKKPFYCLLDAIAREYPDGKLPGEPAGGSGNGKTYGSTILPGTFLQPSQTLLSHEQNDGISMMKTADQVIILDRIRINGRLHRLNRELPITVGHESDQLTLSNEEFGLLVSAPTLEEGIAGISEEFSTLWEVYVSENPANLARDALRLRSHLESLVTARSRLKSNGPC